ncbi:hypothetical protein WDU94_007707 [Cyamophila willieti]
MQSFTVLPVCICFFSLLITSTTAAAGLPQHVRARNEQESLSDDSVKSHFIESGEENITPNESSEMINFEHSGSNSGNDEALFDSNKQDLIVGGWWNPGVHNLTVGYKTYQDRVLIHQYVFKPSRFGRIVEQTISYPVNNSNRFIISFVEVYDQHSDRSDAGYVKIVSGGVGNRNITLHFESKRNHGLKYLVQIWGHYSY